MHQYIYDVPFDLAYPLKVKLEAAGLGPIELSMQHGDGLQEVRFRVDESQADGAVALIERYAPSAKRGS